MVNEVLTGSTQVFLLLKLKKLVVFVIGAIVVSILILFVWLERHSGGGLNLSQFKLELLYFVS